MNKYYVTTPVYYVNDVPHIGHAYTTVAADVLARHWRQKLGDENVFFLTGTDEHGAKIAQAAGLAGQDPKIFADSVVPKFEEAWSLLNISHDHFFRTTDVRHETLVSEVIQKVYDKGFVYEGVYEGLYCVACEKFLTEEDLRDGKCPLHSNREPQQQKEKNYFFKLSEFQNQLVELFEKDEVQILPATRKSEILGKLKLGLKDVSISREGVSWGIPIPWDTTQTIYVWFEALLNYYTATRFLSNKERFWPADTHLIGKDILWFHTVVWSAMLLAAELPLPKKVFAHGFFTINGQKMSKSLGNSISPQELIGTFGIDATRYLLLSAFPFGQDGDFSLEKLRAKYNSELANGLGNLVSRVAKLAEQAGVEVSPIAPFYNTAAFDFYLENLDFTGALAVFKFHLDEANKYIDENKPWELLKNGRAGELSEVLLEAIAQVRGLTAFLKSVMPETADKIQSQFAGPKVNASDPLFPRIS